MPIKILERMYNSSPRGLSQVEETRRLGLRGGEWGADYLTVWLWPWPCASPNHIALVLTSGRTQGLVPWAGPGASSVPLAQESHGARQCLSACGREGWGCFPSSMGQNPTGPWSIPMATMETWGSSTPPPRQPTTGADPTSLPKPAVRAGGTPVGGWSSPSHASWSSSLGATEEGSYSLTHSAHRARFWERLSND